MIRRRPDFGSAFALFLLVAAIASDATAYGPVDAPIAWREYGAAAFSEATETGRPVFLVLTAPWNRDHFLFARESLSDPRVVAELERGWVPILADASLRPELRASYSIDSGLLPSFHFLDADGRPFASFPPMGAEELLFYLGELIDPANRLAPVPGPETKISRVVAPLLAERVADRMRIAVEEKRHLASAVHGDLDAAPAQFLLEYGGLHDEAGVLAAGRRQAEWLAGGPLRDRGAGGLHRSMATPDGMEIHREKTLRTNALAISALAAWFRRTGDDRFGDGVVHGMRFLGDELRVGPAGLQAGSAAADVLEEDGEGIRLSGREYFLLDPAARAEFGAPAVSEGFPIGPNFAFQRTLLDVYRVFLDERMRLASAGQAEVLLAEGFEPDGTARRLLGEPGRGGLRDQADAGLGLLAIHVATGNREALRAAERLADALLSQYLDRSDSLLRSVSRRDGAPPWLAGAAPDPRWNGRAVRFLADLGQVTDEPRWTDTAREILAAWAARLPADASSIAELGWAALATETERPIVCLAADPADESGTMTLRIAALKVADRLTPIRWIHPGEDSDRIWAEARGIEIEDGPAIYLVDPAGRIASAALREEEVLREVFVTFKRRVDSR